MDAAVFVLSADPPVSASERDLLGTVAGLSVIACSSALRRQWPPRGCRPASRTRPLLRRTRATLGCPKPRAAGPTR
jgi:hypothetical protein